MHKNIIIMHTINSNEVCLLWKLFNVKIYRTKCFEHKIFAIYSTSNFSYNLFLLESCAREQVDCLLVPKVTIIAEEEKDKEKLTHVLLLLIAIQTIVCVCVCMRVCVGGGERGAAWKERGVAYRGSDVLIT